MSNISGLPAVNSGGAYLASQTNNSHSSSTSGPPGSPAPALPDPASDPAANAATQALAQDQTAISIAPTSSTTVAANTTNTATTTDTTSTDSQTTADYKTLAKDLQSGNFAAAAKDYQKLLLDLEAIRSHGSPNSTQGLNITL